MSFADNAVRRALAGCLVLVVPLALIAGVVPALAQDVAPPPDPNAVEADAGQPQPDPGPPQPDTGPAEGATDADTEAATEPSEAEDAARDAPTQPNYLELMLAGGKLMIPILIMSLLVVTFGVERFLGLRRHKVLPPELISGLGALAAQRGGLDPRQAYKLCQQYPSTAAVVIKTMLLKVGRPHTEVEHAVSEANEREAARLYSNVRWISLAAGVTPLLGLLGTVWGMIQAFHVTANLPKGVNKADYLAEGIYVALVTTFAGLAVAIPAAVLAHWYEGWIQKLFRELDETLLGLMPQLERFEGRLRVSKEQMDDGTPQRAEAADSQEPAAAPK